MGAGASSPSEFRTVNQYVINPTAPSSTPVRRTQPPVEFSSPSGTLDKSVDGQWQLADDHSASGTQWSNFAPEVSERLEGAFKEGKTACAVVLNKRLSTVDFTAMECVIAGGSARRVRRLDATKAAMAASDASGVDPFAEVNTGPVPAQVEEDGTLQATECSPDDREATYATGPFSVDLHSIIHAHHAPVFSVSFAPDGAKMLTGAKDGTMKYWETASSYVLQEYAPFQGSVLSVAVNKVYNIIAAGCDDQTARLYNTGDSVPKATLTGHNHKVYGVNFTRDGKTLLTTSMDHSLRTWDVNRHECIRAVQCHESSIFSMASSPATPHMLITASDDCTLAMHDLRVPGDSTVVRRFEGHTKTLWGCDIRYDDGQFISCGMDNTVRMWDPRKESEALQVITSHSNPVHCVEYMPDGYHFLSSSRDRCFKITDAVTGISCLSQAAHTGHVYKVSFNAVTQTVVTCGADSCVKLWSVKRA